MSQVKAREVGMNLELSVGDEWQMIVKPIPAKLGAALFAMYSGIMFEQVAPENVERDATNMANRSIGEENVARLEELRWQMANDIASAAFFWNVQGGGIDLVQEMLSDGHPKAQATLMDRNGMASAYSQLMMLRSGVSENPTRSQGATPATSIPSTFKNESSARTAAKPKPPTTASSGSRRPKS